MISRWWQAFRSFLLQSKRVWQVTRKPTGEEFRIVAKVSALGIAIIGLLGFVIFLIWHPIGFK
ncbi:MAG: protein translocase SEC61 complex subunit gamma [Nanoarchaeota archaeon]